MVRKSTRLHRVERTEAVGEVDGGSCQPSRLYPVTLERSVVRAMAECEMWNLIRFQRVIWIFGIDDGASATVKRGYYCDDGRRRHERAQPDASGWITKVLNIDFCAAASSVPMNRETRQWKRTASNSMRLKFQSFILDCVNGKNCESRNYRSRAEQQSFVCSKRKWD